MALDENAHAANIVGSLQQYFRDNLVDVLNSSPEPPIDYGGGLPFKDEGKAEWIQLRPMAAARPAWGLGPYGGNPQEPDSRGQELFWLLNVNCFVRSAKQLVFTNLRIWMVRDLVTAICREGTRIPVKDYVGTQETIGYLFVDSILEDRRIYDPEREELEQHNLVFAMRWTETWRA